MTLLLAVLACRHTLVPPPGDPPPSPPPPSWRVPLPGLRDAACGPEGCLALVHGREGLLRVPELESVVVPGLPGDWDTLVHPWAVEGPCADGRCRAELALAPAALGPPAPVAWVEPGEAPPTVDLAAEVAALRALLATQVERRWRIGFQRLLIAPDGAPVALSRGPDGTGQLVRAGSPPRVARVSVGVSAASFPGVFALHPRGEEAYLLAWPGTVLRAFDPLTLSPRWSLPLLGAAQGWFVDADGRFLLAGTGPALDERFVDWPLPAVDPVVGADPAADERLRVQDRPPVDRTVVVDLARRAVVVEARGRLRRWVAAGEGRYLLATDQELVLYTPRSTP